MASKVRYPVGFKLNAVITAVLVCSLGLVILLVAVFARSDVERTAARNNDEINRMAAHIVGAALSSIRADTLVFLAGGAGKETGDFFFSRRDGVAALILPEGAGSEGRAFYNGAFMAENEIGAPMFDRFLEANPVAVSRARMGETVLFNAAPFFGGVALLALILPVPAEERLSRPAVVFFSAQELTDSFGTGANSSFLTNDSGAALIYSDQDVIKSGGSLSDEPFVHDCWNGGGFSAGGRFRDARGAELFVDFERVEDFGAVGVFTTIPAAVVFEGINAATRRNIALLAMIAFLSILFIWFFSKSFSAVLVRMREAVEQIDDGNYHIRLENKRTDETGVLSKSILSMSYAISNFERFVNRMIVRLSKEGKLRAEGTDKTATLFFSDIRSFTAISEKIEAAGIVAFLNDYMERMVRCVQATGGAIDKFIGDAVMAHWGLVETGGSEAADALNAARSALMMRAALMTFNAGRDGSDRQPKIRIGCGLNTGVVVAGQIGSFERIVYTVIGEPVHFADRTETFTKPYGGEILITEHTWRHVHEAFICEELPAVKEAGRDVRIFALVNTKTPEEGARLLEILDAMPAGDEAINRACVGPSGPRTLKEVRVLLGIAEPDFGALNMDEEERKYAVAGVSSGASSSGEGGDKKPPAWFSDTRFEAAITPPSAETPPPATGQTAPKAGQTPPKAGQTPSRLKPKPPPKTAQKPPSRLPDRA